MDTSNYQPYCFNCSRATDHLGEHDALHVAGLVTYDDKTGCVLKTSAWTRELAARVSDAEYQLVYASELDPVIEMRAKLDQAIDLAHASVADQNTCVTSMDSIDWSECDRLFKAGLSLVLGCDVTTIAQS